MRLGPVWTDDAYGVFMGIPFVRRGLDIASAATPVDTLYVENIVTFGGSNARIGTATLVNGIVTVANTSITADTEIFVNHKQFWGSPGVLSSGTIVPGTSFVITSDSDTDQSVVKYLLIEVL